jgi:tetratricopeptide repeat protein 21B
VACEFPGGYVFRSLYPQKKKKKKVGTRPQAVAAAMADPGILVQHYARAGYFRHIQTVCNDALKKRSNDPALLFWRALGMLKEGSVNEAIREYEAVASRGDVQLALPVKLALLHAHKASKVVDSEEVMRLEQEIDMEDSNASDRARLMAAQVLWHLGDVAQAKEQVDRLLQLQSHSVPGLALRGWLDLHEAQEELASGFGDEHLSAAELSFGHALEASAPKKDLEALMGRARIHLLKRQFRDALDQLNQVVVTYSWFLPALVEKCSVLIAMGDWDQAIETAERVLAQEPHNAEALRVQVLHLLSQEGRYAQAVSRIQELIDALTRYEPQNGPLYHRMARSFARLSGRNPGVLQQTLKLMERACKLAPASCAVAAELGYQQMLSGDLVSANGTLKQASMLATGSEDVVIHQTRCMILLGEVDDAEQQLDFVSATALTRTPETALCGALIARQRGSTSAAISLLDEALELHMPAVRGMGYSDDFFVRLKPDLVLDVAREYLKQCGSEAEVRVKPAHVPRSQCRARPLSFLPGPKTGRTQRWVHR